MSLDGTGGVVTVGKAEGRRVELASLDYSGSGRPTRVAFMGNVDEAFQIPAFIATPHVSDPSAIETSYGHRLFGFV